MEMGARQILQTALEQNRSAFDRHEALGWMGRRFDFEVLGMSEDKAPTGNELAAREIGSMVIEHLLMLGEYVRCRRFASNNVSVLQICEKLEKFDKLNMIVRRDFRADIVKGVRGWLTDDEALVLESLSASVPAGKCVVEIGSFCGRSTTALALGSRLGVRQKSIP